MSSSSDDDDDGGSMFGFGRGSGSIALSKRATAKEDFEWIAPNLAPNKSGLSNEIPIPKPLQPKKNSITPADKLPIQSKIEQEVFTNPPEKEFSEKSSKIADISASMAPVPIAHNSIPSNQATQTSPINPAIGMSSTPVHMIVQTNTVPLPQQTLQSDAIHQQLAINHASQVFPQQQQLVSQQQSPFPPQQQFVAQPSQQESEIQHQSQPYPKYSNAQPLQQYQSFSIQQPIQSSQTQQPIAQPPQPVPQSMVFNSQTGQWQIISERPILNQQSQPSQQSQSIPQNQTQSLVHQQSQPIMQVKQQGQSFIPQQVTQESIIQSGVSQKPFSLPSNQSISSQAQNAVSNQDANRKIMDRHDSHNSHKEATKAPPSHDSKESSQSIDIEDNNGIDEPFVWGLGGSSLSLSGVSIGSRNKEIREAVEIANAQAKAEREKKILEFEKEISKR